MDTPPPILAYATPDTGVRFEEDRVIVLPPPPGYEIALLSIAFLVCVGSALLGLILGLASLMDGPQEQLRSGASLVFMIIMVSVAKAIWRNISRRRAFGRFPCTIRREPTGNILIYFPAIWGEMPRKYKPGELARPKILRRGWTGNLVPLYYLRLRFAPPPYLTTVVIPFVTPNYGDIVLLEQRLTELLLGVSE